MKALFLLLLCSPALADTLTYQSQTLAGQSQLIDGGNTDVNPINDVYTVTITVSGPLAPNLNMAMIAPQSWTVVCQSCAEALSSASTVNPSGLVYMQATSAVFMFSTDATGKITSWNFAISGNSTISDGAGGSSPSSGSFSSGDNATSTNLSESGHQYTVTTSGPKGSWTQSSLSAPAKPAPPPAPPASVVARLCTAASNPQWAKPVQHTGFGLSTRANGSDEFCGYPDSAARATTYIQVSSDGGKTSSFVTLASLGLGK